MAKINVRDYYPFYEHDEFVEGSDELADNALFFGLLHRMNPMRKSLPTNNSESLWLRFPQSSGNAFTLITY